MRATQRNRKRRRGAARRGTDRLLQVVELLAAGAWQEAHKIVQQEDSAQAAWLHGIVHTLEGDLANARHWYRRAERVFPGPSAVQAEIAAAREVVKGGLAVNGLMPSGLEPAEASRRHGRGRGA